MAATPLATPADLTVLSMRPLRGPNRWTTAPVLECQVDLGCWFDRPSDRIPELNERLRAWLPGLIEHRCSIGERGGFLERLRRGTYMAHILEHVAIELHGLTGVDIYFGRARETRDERVYIVVIKYKDESLAKGCILQARDLCMAAAKGQDFDLHAAVEQLREVASRCMLSADMQFVINAAERRRIPHIRIGEAQLVQFGYGVHQRRMLGMLTDRQGAIAASLPENRDLLGEQMWAAGIPHQLSSAHGGAEERSRQKEYRLLMVGGKLVAALEARKRDVTEEVHPEVSERASEAIRALKWDLASIDIVARDIGRPLESQGGIVVDLKPRAELGIHLAPQEGIARPVDDAVLNLLFAPGESGRIPIAAVTGTNGKTTVARLLAHILKGTGKTVGLTCSDGIYLDGRRIAAGDCSGPDSARAILMHPRADAGVFETARGGILRAGVAFTECDVAVVTNLGRGDHLGIDGVDTVDALAKVKEIVVQTVSANGTAVLNAADALVANMAEKCKGRVLFVARDGCNPLIRKHRSAGGQAIFLRDGAVVFAAGTAEHTLVPIDRIPLTLCGRIRFQVENVLAAFGAAVAMNVPLETVVAQAATFLPDLHHDPSRFNVFDCRGATIILDYGHNVDALQAVSEALDVFPNAQRAAVFSSAGDRRDEDILRMGELLGAAFDRVILYEDSDLYERQPGEIVKLLRSGMARSGRVKCIQEIQGGLNALHLGLGTVQPGELLLAQAHLANPTLEYVRSCGEPFVTRG